MGQGDYINKRHAAKILILLRQSLKENFQKLSQVSLTLSARIVVWPELPLIKMKLSPERKLPSMFSLCWNEISGGCEKFC